MVILKETYIGHKARVVNTAEAKNIESKLASFINAKDQLVKIFANDGNDDNLMVLENLSKRKSNSYTLFARLWKKILGRDLYILENLINKAIAPFGLKITRKTDVPASKESEGHYWVLSFN